MEDGTTRRSTRAKKTVNRLGNVVDSSQIDEYFESAKGKPMAMEDCKKPQRPKKGIKGNAKNGSVKAKVEEGETSVIRAPGSVQSTVATGKTSRKLRKQTKVKTKKGLHKTEQKKSRKPATRNGKATASKPTPKRKAASGSSDTKRQKIIASQDKKSAATRINDTRPLPIGEPEVWAMRRQGLCETLPYYNAYQGGAYTRDHVLYGFLLAEDDTKRVYIDDQVVITRAAGHQERGEDGRMKQISDHTESEGHIQTIMNTHQMRVAVVLICTNTNKQVPSRMPHAFNVLGYFHITDCWFEKNHGKVCFKYRFEKVHLEKESWWKPAASKKRDPPDYSIKVPQDRCHYCKKTSKQVYEKWICLNHKCDQFWTYENGRQPAADLKFSTEFLTYRNQWPEEEEMPYDLRPAPFVNDPDHRTLAFDKSGWRGLCCPRCGCCSSRVLWDRWQCPAPDCGYVHQVELPVISSKAAFRYATGQFDGHAIPTDLINRIYVPKWNVSHIVGNYRLCTYELLPGNFIYHFQVNKKLVNAPGGPEELFKALQGNDFGLSRLTLQDRHDKGAMLSNHFAVNFGAPYKYVMATEARPFAQAPPTILQALQRLRWAGHYIGQPQDGEFNELLAVGYFQGGSMSWHDDGEKELGPTVATMALGAPARMQVRLKKKYWAGFDIKSSGATFIRPDYPILPGSVFSKEREGLKARYTNGEMSSAQYEEEYLELMQGSHKSKHDKALDMTFNHGDIIIMHGADIQKYYEHMVINTGDLRFALTCRHIKWDQVPEEHHWKGKFDASMYPAYDGSIDAIGPTRAKLAPVSRKSPTSNSSGSLPTEAKADPSTIEHIDSASRPSSPTSSTLTPVLTEGTSQSSSTRSEFSETNTVNTDRVSAEDVDMPDADIPPASSVGDGYMQEGNGTY